MDEKQSFLQLIMFIYLYRCLLINSTSYGCSGWSDSQKISDPSSDEFPNLLTKEAFKKTKKKLLKKIVLLQRS